MAPLQIGVMTESVQLSDIVGIDILGNLIPEYVGPATAGGFGPSDLVPMAIEMDFHYISTTLEPARMTPTVKVVPTVTYDDAPRDLDILIIGGPMLTHRPASADRFMKEAFQTTKVIMTTCVGSMWLASAGVLDGKKATTNRGALELARKLYPKTEWLDQRWVVDGNLWTSGGAFAGVDMIATYAYKNYDEKLVRFAVELLDCDPAVRGQFYN